MRSVGSKLLFAVTLPALVAALTGVLVLWGQTDRAMRHASETEAVQLARFIATSFNTVDDVPAGARARAAHRAVTHAIRADWSTLTVVSDLRIIDRDGVVRWSRRIEEEDKPHGQADRVRAITRETTRFDAPTGWLPLQRGTGGEVLLPLGGVACAGCHTKESTLRTGTLQLTVDEPSVRTQVSDTFRRALSLVMLFVVVVGLAVGLALHFLLGRPVRRLTKAMGRAEQGDVLVRASEGDGDEIARLGKSFNRMLARLTELKAAEIDNQRDLERARLELAMKSELERVNERLRAKVDELQLLYENARTLSSTLALDEVLERITRALPAHLEVPRFSLMLQTPDGRLEVKTTTPAGVGTPTDGSVTEGVCRHAAVTGKSVYVPDLAADTRFRPHPHPDAASGSLLVVPLVHGGEVLGVLNFQRSVVADFSADEIEFFTAVASQAAMAVKNARLHEQTVALSVTDPLTQVPNRRFLFAQLESEVARAGRFGTPVSLVMIDIDHFKKLNDREGHPAGDEVLRQVASLLRRSVRRVDTLARYGGEEFAVLLPQLPRKEALDVAEKLRAAVATAPLPHGAEQPLGKITISVGVATLPDDAPDMDQLVDRADAALYASKRAGRDRATAFTPGMEVHPTRERGPQRKPTDS